MKRLNFKSTSKKPNLEAFVQLSATELRTIKGGDTETPPEDSKPPQP
jgi:hypothetical protein